MGYRKFTADNIFTGHEMLDENAVLLTDENGKIITVTDRQSAGEGIEDHRGIILPGLINCHCHLELSHMKGVVPAGTGMVTFLLTVMSSRNNYEENIVAAIAAAEEEMKANGIVAVGDICNTGNTIRQKQQNNLRYHNFVETIGVSDAVAEARFAQALELVEKFKGGVSIVPHAPYSVSQALLGLINTHQPEALLTIHNQESHAENELFQYGTGDFLELYKAIGADSSLIPETGRTSIRSYLNRISPSHSILLVHDTVTSDGDLQWIQANRSSLPELYWCICPNANLYINNMLANINMLAESGYKMVVGTDSLASNDQLDIIAELKTLQRHFPDLALTELLRWATINGAEALRVQGQYGSFERGKIPGVVLLENTATQLTDRSRARRLL